MAQTQAQRRATERYQAAHVTQFNLRLNNGTDADIIEKLGQVENKQGYIKSLIRADLKCK